MEKLYVNGKFLPLLLALALTASCSREQAPVRETIPLVRSILSDPDGGAYAMLAGHSKPSIQGNIYVIGSSERCQALCDRFMIFDAFDNVDGSRCQDGLPDFAGETISAVLDNFNTPYSSFIEHGGEDRLREVNVRNLLMAIDTMCYLSPYDMDGAGNRKGAKIVVLASPYADAFGHFDADTLLRSTGCAVRLMCPLSSMIEHLFHTHEGNINVGVIPNYDVVASGIYESVFHEIAQKYGRDGSGCVVYSMAEGMDPIRCFLDNYLEEGSGAPLDAILVDDFTVDMDDAAASLEALTSVMSEESLIYGDCIAPGFELLDSRTEVLERCFNHLRQTNTFTHNIHYPRFEYFITVESPGADTLSYKLMRYDEKFIQQ